MTHPITGVEVHVFFPFCCQHRFFLLTVLQLSPPLPSSTFSACSAWQPLADSFTLLQTPKAEVFESPPTHTSTKQTHWQTAAVTCGNSMLMPLGCGNPMKSHERNIPHAKQHFQHDFMGQRPEFLVKVRSSCRSILLYLHHCWENLNMMSLCYQKFVLPHQANMRHHDSLIPQTALGEDERMGNKNTPSKSRLCQVNSPADLRGKNIEQNQK